MATTQTDNALDMTTVGGLAFSTTVQGDVIADGFMTRLGLRTKNAVAGLALARSLSVPTVPSSPVEDEPGKPIKGQILFGTDDLRTWLTLIFEHGPADRRSGSELQELVRRHWTRGLGLLEEDWTLARGDY